MGLHVVKSTSLEFRDCVWRTGALFLMQVIPIGVQSPGSPVVWVRACCKRQTFAPATHEGGLLTVKAKRVRIVSYTLESVLANTL